MLISHNREKLINAIIYFVEETGSCGKIKLFKLLYFLDFEHYKLTGRSVTGLDYFAWRMGPVPVALMDELEIPAQDFSSKIEIEQIPTTHNKAMLSLRAKAPFDPSHFTKRELNLLKELADQYALSRADEMIEYTHAPTLPWHQVFEEEKRPQAQIPYAYALAAEEREAILGLALENEEMRHNYQ